MPPDQALAERLLRHALGFSTARDEVELLNRSVLAAGEVSGLSTPAILVPRSDGVHAWLDRRQPSGLGKRLADVDRATLTRVAAAARRRGASSTIVDGALATIGVRSMITVPVGDDGTGPVLLIVDEAAGRADPATVRLLELLAAHAWTGAERLRTLRRLAEKADSDPLTGLRHHGPFGERLAAATPGRTALLTIDVDRFKQLNDTYGHQAGDRALVDLARNLQQVLREGDELYRIGGDEFAVVADVPRPEEARAIADRLVAAARLVGRSISVGVAMQAAGETPEQTLRRADFAMYQAKRSGRDGVRMAPRRIPDVA